MKRIFIPFVCIVISLPQIKAQWTNNNPNTNFAWTGSVGIGTAPNTQYKFHIQAAGSTTLAGSLALFSSSVPATAGNFYGIQIDKNSYNSLLLGVNKNSLTGPAGSDIRILANAPFISSYSGPLCIGRGTSGLPNTSDITIASNGNVGIGTNNPTQLLSVKGTILATQVLVYPTTNSTYWPDYVFRSDYKLKEEKIMLYLFNQIQ